MSSMIRDTTQEPATAASDGRPAVVSDGGPAVHERPRGVENVTRVTVAFPFATIKTAEPDLTPLVRALSELVAALATELDARCSTPASADLAERARVAAQHLDAR